MIETALRPGLQRIVINPIVKRLPASITPNTITIAGLCIGSCVLPLLLLHQPWLAVLCLCLSGLADTMDGSLARLREKTSDLGGVIDIISDRWVEAITIIALCGVAPAERGLLSAIMLGTVLLCVTSFLLVGMFSENHGEKSFYYSPGMIERAEAFAFFIAMILAPRNFTVLAICFSLLVLLTTATRLYQFYKQQSH
jgi:archaetidylinositol phosphate synthase